MWQCWIIFLKLNYIEWWCLNPGPFVIRLPLLEVSLKWTHISIVLNSDVGIGAIVCDSNGDVILAMECFYLLIGSTKLAETFALYKGIWSKALEARISPLWAKIDSLIVWNLLVGKMWYVNKIQAFANSIKDLYLLGSIKGFFYYYFFIIKCKVILLLMT